MSPQAREELKITLELLAMLVFIPLLASVFAVARAGRKLFKLPLKGGVSSIRP